MAISLGSDLIPKLQGLLENPEIGPKLKALMPDGFDPAKLLAGLRGDSDLLGSVQKLLPGVDVLGSLSGLTGAPAEEKIGEATGKASAEAEGILGKVQDLFGR